MPEKSHAHGNAAPNAFRCFGPRSDRGIVLICDHASNRVPAECGDLGVSDAILAQHLAWDIGAEALTQRLSELLEAGAVLSTVSRLVIDCNRPPGHETSIPQQSHGIPVPGNVGLGPGEVQRREQAYFHPYQAAIDAALRDMEAAAVVPSLVSIHSFTPELNSLTRPWHLGILSDLDRRMADVVLKTFAGDPDWVVGDNKPYSGNHPEGYSCRHHGDDAGRPNLLVEVRQDLLADSKGVERVARALAPRIVLAVEQVTGAERGSGRHATA